MEKLIAKDLLSINAVFLRPEQPFTWASGIKSPIYCDNRLTLSDVKVREDVEEALASIIKTHFPECEMVMGTATAGIAHAAIVATKLNLPMGYVRASAKDHGRTNQIEGKCEKGTKVVVVEDLISTAGSSLEVVKVLRENGVEDQIEAVKALTPDNRGVDVAVEENYIKPEDKAKLLHFRDNPSDESWMQK